MKCCINALIRPTATFSLKGEGLQHDEGREPSPFRERVRGARVRACVAIFSFASSAQFAFACPLCKDAIPPGMAKGFFWSILLMIAVPMIVVGVIVRELWRAEKKKQG